MKKAYLLAASIGSVVSFISPSPTGRARADGPEPSQVAARTATAPTPAMPADLARRVEEVADVVLEHHIDPPARQQMILSGIKGLYRTAGVPAPPQLGRRVSAIVTLEQLAALLEEVWPAATAEPVSAPRLERALLEGLLAPVPGGAELMTAKERNAAEQIAGNRYVGILVTLGMDDKQKRPMFPQIMEGGPAEHAGVKNGDLLEEIDGVDTRGMLLRDAVERLRGDEGTDVIIKVRSPKEANARTLKITRGRIPASRLNPTAWGIARPLNGDWKVRLDGPDPIGYVKISAISASTPHELRKLARQMEAEGLRALVLDLRGPGGRESDVHPAVLLADALLESGAIGRIRTTHGETTYRADSDALFRGWPIAVLVDQGTSGTAEWLAAALQDNHRAVVVGSPTRSARAVVAYPPGRYPADDESSRSPIEEAIDADAVLKSAVPAGDGRWSVLLVTGYLERGDGRPLAIGPSVRIGASPSVTQRSGIQPDHLIPLPRPRGGIFGGPIPLRRAPDQAVQPPSKPAEKPGTAPDPVLDAARQVLHKALNPR